MHKLEMIKGFQSRRPRKSSDLPSLQTEIYPIADSEIRQLMKQEYEKKSEFLSPIKMTPKDNKIAEIIPKTNEIGLPKSINKWKDRLANLKCPKLTYDIKVSSRGLKSWAKHPNANKDPQTLPLFRELNCGLLSSLAEKHEAKHEIEYPPKREIKADHKRNASMPSIQMEKIKRLHEDYFISLVECGINIPKDKLDLFKTLFLKHYKKQLIFEGSQKEDDQDQNNNSVMPILGKASTTTKKFLDPDDFMKLINKSSKIKQDKDQNVINLIKSCQSNYNFSNNLLNEDKAYLEKLAQDIARKLKHHYNIGLKEDMDKNIELQLMYQTKRMLNKNTKKKDKDTNSEFSISEATETESIKKAKENIVEGKRNSSIFREKSSPIVHNLTSTNVKISSENRNGKVIFGNIQPQSPKEEEKMPDKPGPKLISYKTIEDSHFSKKIGEPQTLRFKLPNEQKLRYK